MALILASLTRRTLLAAVPASFLPTPGLTADRRPDAWAQHRALQGVPNLYRITADLYRSGQPDVEGFHNLHSLGVKSVLSMRQTVNDATLATGTTLILHRIPMKSRYVAEKSGSKVVAAMQALKQSLALGPTLIHCHHGSDRTGLIAALYRMLYQDWSREAALQELIAGGYGYHAIWANIPRYVDRVDLHDLRARIDA